MNIELIKLETENVENSVAVGTIVLITGLIITGTGDIWLIVRRRRIEVSSSGVSKH